MERNILEEKYARSVKPAKPESQVKNVQLKSLSARKLFWYLSRKRTPPLVHPSRWLHAEPVEKWKVWVARRPLARGGATQHQDVARGSSSRHLTPCTTRQIVSTSLHTFRSSLKYEEYRQRVFIQHGCPGTSDTVRQWPVRFPNYQVPEVVVGEPD